MPRPRETCDREKTQSISLSSASTASRLDRIEDEIEGLTDSEAPRRDTVERVRHPLPTDTRPVGRGQIRQDGAPSSGLVLKPAGYDRSSIVARYHLTM
jgi:hypothetical protein